MYKLQFHDSIVSIPSADWNNLLDSNNQSPFIRHEYLSALEISGCVSIETGWKPCHCTIENGEGMLLAAMPLYLKSHSYGEYVFDWAWANAYKQHGLSYYPKLLSAIPFTPVEGTRILGTDSQAKQMLIKGLKEFAKENQISSIHILFPTKEEESLLKNQDFLQRQSIQFHWKNSNPTVSNNKFESFDEFLQSLNKKRRNNILRERRTIRELGIEFTHIPGYEISDHDWNHFFKCYSNTYLEHGSSPYLNLNFFKKIGEHLHKNIHLIIAHLNGEKIASSLLFRNNNKGNEVAYGRYWGSLKHIPNLHFETAYYQAIQFCIDQEISTFEGGAQGEHKIYRGMSPVTLHSSHFIVNTRFSNAIENFLLRESTAMDMYCNELHDHLPFKK